MELGTLGVIDENDFTTENMKTNDVFKDNEEYSEFRQSGASAVGYEEIGGPRQYRRSQTNINNQQPQANLGETQVDGGDQSENSFNENDYATELRNNEAERASHTENASIMLQQSTPTPSMIMQKMRVIQTKSPISSPHKHRVYIRDDSIELRQPAVDR